MNKMTCLVLYSTFDITHMSPMFCLTFTLKLCIHQTKTYSEYQILKHQTMENEYKHF
jgi:hypothetical protein